MSNGFNQLHQLTLVQLPAAIGETTMAGSLSVTIASDQTAIPITGSITATNASVGLTGAPVPASASAAGGQDGSGNLQILKVSSAGVLSVDGSAVTQPVSQSGAWNVTNISGTVSLPTGAATETTLAAQSAKLPATLGSKASTASLSVVLASDQVALAVSQSGTWNVTNVSGTVSLPTGASTSALQTTANTSLSTIATNTPAVGQAAMAASSPVVLASNQSAIPVTQSGTWTVQPGNTANTTAWLTDQATATATFQAEGSTAGTSITTSYATTFTTGGVMKLLQMRSSCNQPIIVSLDGGTTAHYVLEQGDSVSVDLKSLGLKIAASVAIQVKYTGTAPTAGTFRVNGAF